MGRKTHTSFDLPMTLKTWFWRIANDQFGTTHAFCVGFATGSTVDIPSLLEDTEGWCNNVTHVKPRGVRCKTCIGGIIPDGAIVHVNSGSLEYDYFRDEGGEHPYSEMRRLTCEKGRFFDEHVVCQAHYNVSGDLYPVIWGYDAQEWVQTEVSGDIVNWVTRVYQSDSQVMVAKGIPFKPPSKEGLMKRCGGGRVVAEWGYFSWLSELEIIYDLPSSTSAEIAQVFHERSWIFGPFQRPPKVDRLMANAFYDAYQQFPKFNDNNIANLKEMADLLLDVAKSGGVAPLIEGAGSLVNFFQGGRRPREIFRDIGDLWLKYRYCYGTTKSDVKQALEERARRQITYLSTQHFNGEYETSVLTPDGDGYVDVEVRVGFDVVQQTKDMIRAINHYGYLHGLELSAYTLWDMVPFSFMVDWVCDIGGELQKQQDLNHYSDYIFTNVVWSLKYNRTYRNIDYGLYSRWYDNLIPTEGIELASKASAKTWLKRGADVVSVTI